MAQYGNKLQIVSVSHVPVHEGMEVHRVIRCVSYDFLIFCHVLQIICFYPGSAAKANNPPDKQPPSNSYYSILA